MIPKIKGVVNFLASDWPIKNFTQLPLVDMTFTTDNSYLSGQNLDHDRDTEALVPGPVLYLALPPAIRDGETFGAFFGSAFVT